MSGAQFVWIAIHAFLAWSVFQLACAEASSRAELEARVQNVQDEIAANRTRRATIAQASYWP